MKTDIHNGLNQEQQDAVENTAGPSIILAGAGSGKTRVLTHKVLNLIDNHQVNSTQIIMVTFTNKAAAEMKERVKKNLGFIGTFHSLCARILRHDGHNVGLGNNFVIYDSQDQADLIKEVIKNLALPQKYTPSYFQYRISGAKDQLITPARYREIFKDYSSDVVASVYSQYQKSLEKNNAVDFDDLIFKTVELFQKNPPILEKYQDHYRYILVDEFQDTNFTQFMLTKLLGERYKNVTVVGDFSQSIYSWRGAEIQNLEKFKQAFPETKTFYLERNYRSTQKILDFAYEVISKNQTHPILKVYTENEIGEEVQIQKLENEQLEALFIAQEAQNIVTQNGSDYQDVAVLYRINAQSRVIEEAFLHLGIPYILVGGTRFYERKEVKDILSYLRLLVNPNDEVSLKRALKIGKRKFAEFKAIHGELKQTIDESKTVELIDRILQVTHYTDLYDPDIQEDYQRLENIKELRSVAINYPALNAFLEQIALVESEYSESEKLGRDKKGVYMMTLHQAKGLEFPYVFIAGLEEGILPHSRSIDDLYELEEERRLFYVGITRARKRLFLTHTYRRFFFGRRNYSQVSRFLDGRVDETSLNTDLF